MDKPDSAAPRQPEGPQDLSAAVRAALKSYDLHRDNTCPQCAEAFAKLRAAVAQPAVSRADAGRDVLDAMRSERDGALKLAETYRQAWQASLAPADAAPLVGGFACRICGRDTPHGEQHHASPAGWTGKETGLTLQRLLLYFAEQERRWAETSPLEKDLLQAAREFGPSLSFDQAHAERTAKADAAPLDALRRALENMTERARSKIRRGQSGWAVLVRDADAALAAAPRDRPAALDVAVVDGLLISRSDAGAKAIDAYVDAAVGAPVARLDGPNCPLHATNSKHATEPSRDEDRLLLLKALVMGLAELRVHAHFAVTVYPNRIRRTSEGATFPVEHDADGFFIVTPKLRAALTEATQ